MQVSIYSRPGSWEGVVVVRRGGRNVNRFQTAAETARHVPQTASVRGPILRSNTTSIDALSVCLSV